MLGAAAIVGRNRPVRCDRLTAARLCRCQHGDHGTSGGDTGKPVPRLRFGPTAYFFFSFWIFWIIFVVECDFLSPTKTALMSSVFSVSFSGSVFSV